MLDFSDLAPNANLVSIYSPQDGVQNRGYIDGSVRRAAIKTIFSSHDELRTIPDFNNIKVEQPFFTNPVDGHTNLKTAPVWNKYVKPNLNLNQ